MPIDIIMKAAFSALQRFDDHVTAASSPGVNLKDIYIISNDPKLVGDMIAAFQHVLSLASSTTV